METISITNRSPANHKGEPIGIKCDKKFRNFRKINKINLEKKRDKDRKALNQICEEILLEKGIREIRLKTRIIKKTMVNLVEKKEIFLFKKALIDKIIFLFLQENKDVGKKRTKTKKNKILMVLKSNCWNLSHRDKKSRLHIFRVVL